MKMENYKDLLYQKYVTSHTDNNKNIKNDLKDYNKSYDQHFSSFIPTNKESVIIDLGCGYGSFVFWLQTTGYKNVFGIDSSKEQIDKGKKLGVSNLIHGNAFEYISSINEKYDLIIAKDFLEHLAPEEVFSFLELCNKSLKSGGSILLQVPNAESPYFGRIRYGDFTHEVAYTKSSITQILKVNNFKDIEVTPWLPVRSSFLSNIRFLLWKIAIFILKIPLILETGKKDFIFTMNIIVKAKKL